MRVCVAFVNRRRKRVKINFDILLSVWRIVMRAILY